MKLLDFFIITKKSVSFDDEEGFYLWSHLRDACNFLQIILD